MAVKAVDNGSGAGELGTYLPPNACDCWVTVVLSAGTVTLKRVVDDDGTDRTAEIQDGEFTGSECRLLRMPKAEVSIHGDASAADVYVFFEPL